MTNSIIYSVFAGLLSAVLIDVPDAISGSTSPAEHYREQVTALGKDIRATRVVNNPAVNRARKFRLVVPDKCEKEGELELHRLASSASAEESFVFIPHLCLWIEVGRDERQNQVRLDSNFVDRILEQYYSLIFYHIHVGEANALENFFLAYKDLTTLVLINGASLRKPRIRIRHRFVSKAGVMEYGFSDKQNQ